MRLTKTSDSFGGVVWFRSQDRNDLWLEPCEMTAHDSRMAIDKLAAYEDAEEQGLLVRLPCRAGDAVHFIFRGKVYSGLILHVNLYKGFETQSITMDVKYSVRGHVLICAEEIGKTVFLSREEAEAALKGESKDV